MPEPDDDYSGSWCALLDFACGVVGIREKEFWKMTWNEYQRRVNEYEMREIREWERTRIVACEVFNNDNQKPQHYTQYLPLPTDKEEERNAAKKAADLAFLDKMMASGRI